MSAPATPTTKIFGISLGVDPKVILIVLIALAGVVFWLSSRSEEVPVATTSASRPQSAPAAVAQPALVRRATPNRAGRANDNGVLRVRPVDATRGDVDPTLRLDLLGRVRNVELSGNVRNLFEVGAAPAVAAIAKQIKGPLIIPRPLPGGGFPGGALPAQPGVNIPLKFYGFSRPAGRGQLSRGLFLDGDIVLVAAEGETIKSRYLVVELTPNSARLEDTQIKKGQTLPVIPEAQQQ